MKCLSWFYVSVFAGFLCSPPHPLPVGPVSSGSKYTCFPHKNRLEGGLNPLATHGARGWCGGTSKKYILMIRLQRIVIPNVVHQYLHLFRSSSFQGKLLKHNLDSEVVDALKDLRRKLSENESKTQSSRSG